MTLDEEVSDAQSVTNPRVARPRANVRNVDVHTFLAAATALSFLTPSKPPIGPGGKEGLRKDPEARKSDRTERKWGKIREQQEYERQERKKEQELEQEKRRQEKEVRRQKSMRRVQSTE